MLRRTWTINRQKWQNE